MKLFLTKSILIFFFLINISEADEINSKYIVKTSGIKIGEFSWFLDINGEKYRSRINLKNSGIFSPLYRFKGEYNSSGLAEGNKLQSRNYKQNWKTKKKTKIIEMFFDKRLIRLVQVPEEVELSRINLDDLYGYDDPITSFLNILKGYDSAYTIDGRRIYKMTKVDLQKKDKITLEIQDYSNIWADHKRNDLKKIEFILDDDNFFPKKIIVYFKDRIFKLFKV